MGHRHFEHAFQLESGFSVSRDETPEQHQNRFLVARNLGVAALGLLLQVLPLGIPLPTRLALSCFLWFVVIPVSVIVARRVETIQFDMFQTGADASIICVASLAAPQVWHGAIVVLAGVLVSSIPIQSRRAVVAIAAPAIMAMALAGHLHGIDGWYTPILGLLATLPGFDIYYRTSRQRADDLRARYDALVEAAAVLFWEVDTRSGEFISVAGNVEQLLGYSPAELIQQRWHDLIPAGEWPKLEARASETVEVTVTTDVAHRDGRRIAFQHVVRRVGGTTVMRGVSSDVSELTQAAETIRYQAEHDALTGLYNRAILVERLERAVSAATEARPIALLMIDLDRFKEVNDTLGHPVGDELLRTVAERLAAVLPRAEVVARLGGDEFAILLIDEADRASAVEAARRAAGAVEQVVGVDRIKLSVTPSIGVVLAPDHGGTTEEILRHADVAMYEAKRRGDRVRVFESAPSEMAAERVSLSATIGAGLDQGQFELWYQPKVRIETGEIVGAEGLMRWRHPDRGLLLPNDFLELVSLAGEYHRLTDLALAQGVEAAAALANAGHDLGISVNLASASFFDEDLPERIGDLLVARGLPTHRLILELTEADVLDETGRHLEVFDRLQQLGIGISIDDFGTGHSSLVRLRELPVTEVKLDRSFVSQIATDAADRIIVRTVVDLATALGLTIVAEGVEDAKTADLLASIGCRYGQGYLWARPMPFDHLVEFAATDPETRAVGADTTPSAVAG